MKLLRLLNIVLAAALLAAACGSDDTAEIDTGAETEDTDTEGSEDTDEPEDSTEDSGAEDADDAMEDSGAEDSDESEDAMEEEAGHSCDAPPTKVDGTLTVATGEPVFPPWMIDDDPSNGQGFESAVVFAVAEELGIGTVEWVRTGFDEAIAPGAKDYDFNIQQFSITADRDEVVDFSDGYYQVEQAIIGPADSPAADAATIADLQELRLGAAIGTTSLDYIETIIEPATDAAVYDDNVAAKSGFDAGQIDGLVLDLPTAYYITAVEITDASIIGVLPRQSADPEELGMLFEEGSPLVPCINEALAALRDSGTLEAIEEEWLNEGGAIPTLGS